MSFYIECICDSCQAKDVVPDYCFEHFTAKDYLPLGWTQLYHNRNSRVFKELSDLVTLHICPRCGAELMATLKNLEKLNQ